MYFLIFGIFLLLSWLVSLQLKAKVKEYSSIGIKNGLTGKDIAEKMLRDNGIYDVEVTCIPGELTDHYNPATKKINLSNNVYYGSNIISAAIAAHECGHAVQHATAYSFLQMRSALVPVVSFASNWVQWVLLAGILLVNTFPSILLFGIILFAMITLFSLITLPVEYDASRRAMAWLTNSNLASDIDYSKAQNALNWAAKTYVIAALSSLATLIYYIMIFMGARDDD